MVEQSPKIAEIRLHLIRLGADFAEINPRVAELKLSSAKLNPELVDVLPHQSDVSTTGPVRPNFGRSHAKSDRTC